MSLNDLKPTERQRVYDLVREAGLDVSDWANYRRSEHPACNPKYCYNWAFEGTNRVVLCLWFEDMEEDDTGIFQELNYREVSSDTRNWTSSQRKRALTGLTRKQLCAPESFPGLLNYPLTGILYFYTVFRKSASSMSSEPTKRQQQILDFLEFFQREHGMMPTCQEIAEAFGFRSPNAVQSHLGLLEKKGVIERISGKARGLRLLRTGRSTGIPVLGEIAAGDPILAAEASGEFLPVSDGLFAGTDLFAVRVRGDSMIEKGIFDGDYAVIRAQTDVQDGEIAAVLRDHEATLKIVLRPDPHCLVLRGANPSFSDIVIREGDAVPRILGRYVGLIRLERRVA